MAEVLTNHVFRRGVYPDWTKFFDGETHKLVSGVDFHGDPKKAQSSVYQSAKKVGKKIQSEREGDTILIIRAI